MVFFRSSGLINQTTWGTPTTKPLKDFHETRGQCSHWDTAEPMCQPDPAGSYFKSFNWSDGVSCAGPRSLTQWPKSHLTCWGRVPHFCGSHEMSQGPGCHIFVPICMYSVLGSLPGLFGLKDIKGRKWVAGLSCALVIYCSSKLRSKDTLWVSDRSCLFFFSDNTVHYCRFFFTIDLLLILYLPVDPLTVYFMICGWLL